MILQTLGCFEVLRLKTYFICEIGCQYLFFINLDSYSVKKDKCGDCQVVDIYF